MTSNLIPPIWHFPLAFCLFSTTTTYVVSIITNNVSQIDRVWTFLPTLYIAYFALLPLWPVDPPRIFGVPLVPYTPREVDMRLREEYSPRALMMLALVTAWMVRLTYNTWRRGLFNPKDEDYRWGIIRKKIHPLLFQVFNLIFIAIIQNVLLVSLSIPVSLSLSPPHTLSLSDYTLCALGLIDLALEFTADNQQYSFQSYKTALFSVSSTPARSTRSKTKSSAIVKTDGNLDITKLNRHTNWIGARTAWTMHDARRGFVTRGLWAWSRHPNLFCEQMFWTIITFFPLLAPTTLSYSLSHVKSDPINAFRSHPFLTLYPILHLLCLFMLFISSTIFTEGISVSKYPHYKVYQRRVGMFIPIPWGWLVGKSSDGMLWGVKEE